MLAASLSPSIDPAWAQLEPIHVGRVPAGSGPPDPCVSVTRDGRPLLRIDVHAHAPHYVGFEEVIVWRDLVVIGFGGYVHAISALDRSVVSVELGSYFGHLYPGRDFVLLASGERLFRLEPDRSVAWKSAPLGIDGVLVHDVGTKVIRGEGEWDPPGGWKPFAVSVADGTPTA
jgi:hypothetical protein